MNHDELRRYGVALAERVRDEVDTSLRLDLVLRRHRRTRLVAFATAAAAAVIVVIAALWLAAPEEAPVVTEPPTTIPAPNAQLQPLPIENYLILLSDYEVDPATGRCVGTGPIAGVEEGSKVDVIDQRTTETTQVFSLPAGEEITADDERASFILPDRVTAACLFLLPDLGYSIEDYGDLFLFHESDPDIAGGATVRGQRVVFRLGEIPGDPGFEPAPGVVSDVPEEWQAELDDLRASAGPGRLVVFVNLGAPYNSGGPTSNRQPVCVGTGPYKDITPGAAAVVSDSDGGTLAETILRGSAFDGHIGCSLWFGVDVPAGLPSYTITIGDHPPVTFTPADLDAVGWQVDLWANPDHMQTNCLEAQGLSRQMTCVLLEPVDGSAP